MDTILIVDDATDEVEALCEMLAEYGYRFEVAQSADDVRSIIAAKGQSIKVVLLDWILEGVDGVELMQWMQSHPALTDIEIIVQSAEFDPEYIRAGLDCGAYFYLTKPFEAPQLSAIVRAAVKLGELKRSLAKRIADAEAVAGLMIRGEFALKTREQAEALMVHLASTGGDPQHAVALLELMINAVEHGNLGITYEEKGQLLNDRRFHEEVARRLELPEYRNRLVRVKVDRREDGLEVEIIDEGSGFDFRKYFKMDQDRLFHSHGRGVLLASGLLDLEYFEPGNRVRAWLPLESPESEPPAAD